MLVIVCAGVCVPAAAQPAAPAPAPAPAAEPEAADARDAPLATRLVRFYDFEETDDAGLKIGRSLSDAPEWYPIGRDPQESDPAFLRQPLHEQLRQRRHYPAFGEVRMDDRAARSGEYALYLGLRGGNVGAFVEVGAVPAVPGSDYQVSASVRTDQLRNDGAFVSAYYIDARGRRIAGSVNRRGPIKTDGRWQTVAVSLPGDVPAAAWIGIELEVLQPTPKTDHPLGAEQVVLPDIRGGAWFDDIAVWQLPNVRVGTQSPVNIIRAPDQPELSVAVRDLSGRRLVSEATIYGADMKPLVTDTRRVGAGSPGNWVWRPQLPGYGWYRVDLTTRETQGPAAGQAVARTGAAFLYLPAEPRSMGPADRARFGLVVERASPVELALLDRVLEGASLHAATLSAFHRRATLGDMSQQQAPIDQAIERVIEGGRELTLSLDPLPIELAQAIGTGGGDAIAAAATHREQWEAYLTPVVMRHGQRIRRWQAGSAQDADTYFVRSLPRAAADFDRSLRRLAPEPIAVLPWSIDQAPRDDLGGGFAYAMSVPVGVTPEAIGDYLKRWDRGRVSLELQTPSAADVPQGHRVRDLALRMIHAWEHQPGAIHLPRPWAAAGERREALVPDPLLGVFTNVAHRLAGRRVVGRLALGPGLECRILDGAPGGMLVAWNRSAPADAELEMYLGSSPVAVDVWGNRTPIPASDGNHRLPLPRTPIFIEGIDADLALFRAGFRLDEPLIESAQGVHPRTITLTNPFGRTISGRLMIDGPAAWRAGPATHFFSIAAGKSVELPVGLSFPISEVAGHKKLSARARFRADQPYDIRLKTPMELGLPGIDFQATLAMVEGRTPGTKDVVVSTVITNESDTEVSLYAFASLAGHPRLERAIPALESGESAVRSFRFTDAADAIAEHAVRTGVRENNGPAILNKLLRLDDFRQ